MNISDNFNFGLCSKKQSKVKFQNIDLMNRSVTVIYLYAIYIKITSFFKALEWGEKVLNAYKTLWHDFLKQIRSAYSSWYSPMMLTFIKRLSNIFFWKSNFSLVVSLPFHKSKRSFCLYPDFLFTLVLNSMIPLFPDKLLGLTLG